MEQGILDFDAVRQAAVHTEHFPYFVLDNVFNSTAMTKLIKDFPLVKFPGSVHPDALSYGNSFKQLIEELNGDTLRALIEEKFDINLKDKPTMLTVRGHTRQKDGRIHTDTTSKLVTVLIYFNETWPHQAGRLRLLKDGDSLDHYFDEVTPTIGKLLAFKVTDNCWHGHHAHIGQRQSIQFNYMASKQEADREINKHRRSSKLKQLTHVFSAA